MKTGDTVTILGRKRTLVRQLADIPGGWEINKPVEGFRFWNKAEFWKPLSKGPAGDHPSATSRLT